MFECVWPYCGVGTWRVVKINFSQITKFFLCHASSFVVHVFAKLQHFINPLFVWYFGGNSFKDNLIIVHFFIIWSKLFCFNKIFLVQSNSYVVLSNLFFLRCKFINVFESLQVLSWYHWISLCFCGRTVATDFFHWRFRISFNYICIFMQTKSWHHKFFHFYLPFWIWKEWKGREKITKNWISREQKELFRWNKKHFS